MEEPRAVRWSVDRAAPPQAEAASGAAPGAPDAPAGPAPPRPEPNDPATGPDSQWFTHEMHVPSSVRLNQLFGGGSSAATSSGWSELDLEVERLAQALSQLHCHCDITVVDYCRTRTRFTTGLNNSSIGPFLAKERPPWSKVRWLCVDGGVSGDVLQHLTRAYDLQPLALEDCTTFQRIKIDSYREHLYISSYVWDLVDRPKRDDRRHPAKGRPLKRAATGPVRARSPPPSPTRPLRGGSGGKGPIVRTATKGPGGGSGGSSAHGNAGAGGAGGIGDGPRSRWGSAAKGADVEAGAVAAAAAAARRGDAASDEGAFAAVRRWLGLAGGRPSGLQRQRARRWHKIPLHVGWADIDREEARRWRRSSGSGRAHVAPGFSDDDADSSSSSSSDSDTSFGSGFSESSSSSGSGSDSEGAAAAGVGGRAADVPPSAPGFTGARCEHAHLRSGASGDGGRPGEPPGGCAAWRDDDSAQASLEAWQRKLHVERQALIREWAAVEASDTGAGPVPGTHVLNETRAGREESMVSEAKAASGMRRDKSEPALHDGVAAAEAAAAAGGGRFGPAQSAPDVRRVASAAPGGAPELGPPTACYHLGAKHRRRARLRMPLQAPFFAYQTSGRSLGRKRVMLEQVSFFLCPNGVVISLFQRTGRAVAAPVLARLRGMQSLLIDSECAGVLLQALLQSTLDYSLPVFEAFAAKVAGIDAQLLSGKFEVRQSRRLHLIATDLGIMLRSFSTVQPMLAALQARATLPPEASDDEDDEEEGGGGGGDPRCGGGGGGGGGKEVCPSGGAAPPRRSGGVAVAPGPARAPPSVASAGGRKSRASAGLRLGSHGGIQLTELAGMYLSDVHDQAVTGEQDLAALLEHTHRLSDLVFNSVSHSNESANMILATAGMLFMPLTFVAGVYGMNFEYIPELHWQNGYGYFWGVCIALLIVSTAMLVWAEIMKPPRLFQRAPRAAERLLRRLLRPLRRLLRGRRARRGWR